MWVHNEVATKHSSSQDCSLPRSRKLSCPWVPPAAISETSRQSILGKVQNHGRRVHGSANPGRTVALCTTTEAPASLPLLRTVRRMTRRSELVRWRWVPDTRFKKRRVSTETDPTSRRSNRKLCAERSGWGLGSVIGSREWQYSAWDRVSRD